jgi:CRP-like cAMP-binding protein
MNYKLLSGSPLFKNLSETEIEDVLSGLPFQTRKFRAGNLIAQSGEPVTALLIVTEGVVKGEMVDFAGRVIKIEDIPAPGALASAFLFGNRNQFPVNVLAVSDAVIIRIEKSDFLRLLMSNDRLLLNFLDMISNRSQFLSDKIKFLNFKTIKGKLAQYILLLAGKERYSITLDLTQSDLADYFGVARPSVARALHEMEEDALIEAKGKQVTILNRKGLADIIVPEA